MTKTEDSEVLNSLIGKSSTKRVVDDSQVESFTSLNKDIEHIKSTYATKEYIKDQIFAIAWRVSAFVFFLFAVGRFDNWCVSYC